MADVGEIFASVGRNYGYDKVTAEFSPLRDLKVTWRRSYKLADFKVSDYLEDAPERVLRDMANSIFDRIVGTDNPYSEEAIDYFLSDGFLERNRRTYLKRIQNVYESRETEDGYVIAYESGDPRRALGVSVLFKVIYVFDGLKGHPMETDAVMTGKAAITKGRENFGKAPNSMEESASLVDSFNAKWREKA